jgi:phosphomannomutase
MLSVSGCRGIVGASLTPEVICSFVAAAAGWIAEKSGVARPTIVVACDGRRGGELLMRLAAQALAVSGCRVIEIGMATTPTVGVMVARHSAHGGITLTASHNPAQWNGIKVITAQGSAPDADSAMEIITRYKEGRVLRAAADGFGAIESDATAAAVHVERVLAALAKVADVEHIRQRRFRVVLDSVNASGARPGRMLLDALGCELTHLYDQPTGVFPHTPEPTAENLAELGREIVRARADVGFAQDPDADRLALIDEGGRYVGEEYTLVVAARALLGAASGPKHAHLAANLSTSRMIDDVAVKFGATMHRAAVGEANVVAAMRHHSSVIGGEGNGGVIWPEITWIRDSLGAMALTLALMEREGRPLSALIADFPRYAIEKRKVDLKPGLTQKALAAAERVATGAGSRIDRQDGVRVDFAAPSGSGQAWVHVRASNTEPILRLIAEAPTVEDARAVLDRTAAMIDGA